MYNTCIVQRYKYGIDIPRVAELVEEEPREPQSRNG